MMALSYLQKKILKWTGFSFLIDAANWQQRYQRPLELLTANSLPEEVSLSDWQILVSDSRKLYSNLGPVKGAIDDKAVFSVGRAWDARFTGSAKNKAWGDLAARWVNREWYPVADVRGGMFDFKTDLFLTSVSVDRDGEIYIFLTEAKSGFPQIQMIPAHMIGQRDPTGNRVDDGPYKGMQLLQGVIYNDSGMAVAYRVLGQTAEQDKDYSALNLIQIFDPAWTDQVRGFPAFTHAILDLKDLRTIQGYEKMASAIASSIGLIEKNELGAPDPNDVMNVLRRTQTSVNQSTSTGPTIVAQNFSGVTARFFRAGSGSGLESLKTDRPGQSWDDFMNRLIRNACVGAGWPYELTWDSSKLGGVSVRLLVARAMRTVEDRQDLLRPIARRMVGYAVAKAIKLGKLPPCDEWFEWGFSLPPRMSVDFGRDSAAELADYKFGLTNMRDILAEQGVAFEDHVAARKEENEMLKAAGLPSYGPSDREASDINSPPPALPGDPNETANTASNPKSKNAAG